MILFLKQTVTAVAIFCFCQLKAQQVNRPASMGITGNKNNVVTPVKGGVALIGGGGIVTSAFKWMIGRSGGGDVVVITASGYGDYSNDIYKVGGVNSVETLNITSRSLADNDTVANIIRNAEMLFISGGDQSNYMNFWRGTKTQAAINYLLKVKKAPVGGTSAGCAILSGIYYSGEQGSVESDSALKDPYMPGITLYHNDLLHAPFLDNVLTDQHYLTRHREGRHVTFLARSVQDWGRFINGIAPNERTAVCIDEDGHAKVFGESTAYFIVTDPAKAPETIEPGKPLQWEAGKKALHVYEIQGSDTGAGNFSVAEFKTSEAKGGTWYWWWTSDGKLYKNADSAQNKVILKSTLYPSRPSSLGIIGDTADITTSTKAGIVLMGGGKDVDAAFRWMIARSGGGNVVIIRASGTDAYNPYIFALGKVSSVETLKIDSRELATNETVARIIRNAELLFIAGGDQSVYMNQWKGTITAEAVNYLLNVKKVPVGGTSAGCAILGQLYYSGEGGSVVSKEALADPYDINIKIYKNDFVQARYLHNVITDQHYLTRSRVGRHIVFMSRIITDWNVYPRAIAADERTAVCINEKGIAQVFGSSKAYFILSDKRKPPEACLPGKPLRWVVNEKALKIYELQGTEEGAGSFNVKRFRHPKATGGNWYWWWVDQGEWRQEGVK